MDSSLQSANLTADAQNPSAVTIHEEAVGAEEEHHIHLPNPSWWPLLLSIAILAAVVGLLFLPDGSWLTVIAAPFILIGIMGWALEDPMAAPKEHYYSAQDAHTRFQIGQEVVDRDGYALGTVQARFGHYILADGGIFDKAFYVPHRFIVDGAENNVLHLNVTKEDLLIKNLDSMPDDLYEDAPDFGVPLVNGVPQFARGPLSPAETGHYNYGPNFPGINTDAAGSYHREEVRPTPQKYVADRRSLYTTRKPIPPRVVSAN